MKNPLAGLMQQAQKMQENLQQVQDEIAAAEVYGESGGGLVKVTMNGKRLVQKLTSVRFHFYEFGNRARSSARVDGSHSLFQ